MLPETYSKKWIQFTYPSRIGLPHAHVSNICPLGGVKRTPHLKFIPLITADLELLMYFMAIWYPPCVCLITNFWYFLLKSFLLVLVCSRFVYLRVWVGILEFFTLEILPHSLSLL